jgi:uncharacterized membrane protein
MKSFLFAGAFFIVSSITTGIFYRSYEWIVIILATLLGYALGRISQLGNDVKSLRAAFAKDWEMRTQQQPEPSKTSQQPAIAEQAGIAEHIEPDQSKEQVLSFEDPKYWDQEEEADYFEQAEAPHSSAHSQSRSSAPQPPPQPQPQQPDIVDKGIDLIKNYFTGGNLFVRVGIVILFFGVSFLLKYASDRGLLPIEYRLMAVAAGAIGLLSFGWYLRDKKQTYGLLLQGAGIGMLYLDVFAAFSLYHLIPSLPAFALLFVISMFAAALAVLQNSRSLAILGFSGGFLAPVFTSTGSNNYVGLFSYYVILNIALVTIAWFKAWRELNLLGFFFTFIVGTSWGVTQYVPENFSTTEPFLIIFFLLYVLIAVLFALRQPPKLRGYVDGTLLFGVPLAAAGLQYGLVRDVDYGISISAFAMGAFYLALAWWFWRRAGDGLRLLSEAFLALGVIFASLAIPFALAPTHTAAAWGLEGLGLMWLGSRQNRLSVRFFGLLLQIGAGFFVFVRHDMSWNLPFINGTFISSMMMAIAGILSARLLFKDFTGRKVWEKSVSWMLLIWGLLWLFGGFIHQIDTHYGYQWLEAGILTLAAIVSLGFMLTALRTQPMWQHAWHVSTGLLAIMLMIALSQIGHFNLAQNYPFRDGGWLAWPLAFAVMYAVIYQIEKQQVYQQFSSLIHTLTSLLLVAIITWQGSWYLLHVIPEESGWARLWLAIPATVALWTIIKKMFWPRSENHAEYRLQTGMVLAIYLILWGLVAVVARGDSEPLPWIPLLNPLDITLGIVLITLFKWWQSISDNDVMDNVMDSINRFKPDKNVFAIGIAGLIFLWLNFTLFRIASHWFGIAYNPEGLYHSNLVQSSVSVLWALSGVLLTIFASRRQMRTVWIAGGILLGIVVLKLFVIDLSSLGSLARIVSFLVVGALLTSIGYFAPLPDKNQSKEDKEDKEDIDDLERFRK